jgi:hypothetical protein
MSAKIGKECQSGKEKKLSKSELKRINRGEPLRFTLRTAEYIDKLLCGSLRILCVSPR